ncbi:MULTISPECIES: pantetheine-phosphate adenylyltransferase [Nesterenkonia]|uniref:Phosphopantetheine adenylyltransferase n=2 Tax=Nesterenkonia TaxID=57494 RepID=A0A0W8IHC8_9MICC|nr:MULTISPECIES: pantetheine-phosphate adenylyltransferase [Nesterenkonia]KUG59104.1 phosphopantetheine adenylyltransferase [Nesterenkonia jeotgali]MBA8921054.1 pantetheine-phosphate adenylyltransferase [Nesterenkonia jeotgali]NYJ17391.1 pantetheine-phosphate adenylyltransferase [Nesterenkonia sandarakina]
MQLAVCPGSFDPLHNGHVEIIARASNLFDEVIVAVSSNMHKNPMFSVEERMEMARETFSYVRGVSVKPLGTGLLTDFCKEVGANALVKGLRDPKDLSYESPMATMNRHLSGLETVFLAADGRYTHLSSTLVKEVHTLGGDVAEFIPRAVQRRLKDRRR